MRDPRKDLTAAEREEQFLALLRSGAASGPERGIFDVGADRPDDVLLRAIGECGAPAPGADLERRSTPAASTGGWRAANWLWRLVWRSWRFTRELSGDDAYDRY